MQAKKQQYPDEWASTKQACRGELTIYTHISGAHQMGSCIYLDIYIPFDLHGC